MAKHFYTNSDEISSETKKFTETGKANDDWTVFYRDSSNQSWELNRYESDFSEESIRVLKKSNCLTIEDLINIAVNSNQKNEIIGAAIELYFEEYQNKKDFRGKLIEKLLPLITEDVSEFNKERLKIIIHETQLYDSLNRRDVVGKTRKQVEDDSDYYLKSAKTAKTAKKILKILNEL